MRFVKKLPHVLALGAVIIVFTTFIVLLAFWLRNVGQGKEKKASNQSNKLGFRTAVRFESSAEISALTAAPARFGALAAVSALILALTALKTHRSTKA